MVNILAKPPKLLNRDFGSENLQLFVRGWSIVYGMTKLILRVLRICRKFEIEEITQAIASMLIALQLL